MIKFLKNNTLKVVDLLELIISVLLAISIGILTIFLAADLKLVLINSSNAETFNTFLNTAFNLVIGIEFIKMLCKHTPATILEVLLFAIARQLIVGHANVLDNLIGVISIAILFAIRRYLLGTFDVVDKTIYKSNEKVKRINMLESISIPYTDDETLEDVIMSEIDKRNLTLGTGLCIYYSGFALRIAKMRNHEIVRVEVIRSIK